MKRLLFLLMLASTVSIAQSGGPFEISRQTIDGGGGISSDIDYVLTGTIGQPETTVSISGPFELRGGFWSGAQASHLFRDSLETELPNRVGEPE